MIPSRIYPSSQKMSTFGDMGINIDDPDEIENALENNYNHLFQKSYLNHQRNKESQLKNADIDDCCEIENYEKLYLDSFKAHKLKEEVKMPEEETFVRDEGRGKQVIIGRIYLGQLTLERMERDKAFTEAEVAGIMAAKRASDLIPAHLSRAINKAGNILRKKLNEVEILLIYHFYFLLKSVQNIELGTRWR